MSLVKQHRWQQHGSDPVTRGHEVQVPCERQTCMVTMTPHSFQSLTLVCPCESAVQPGTDDKACGRVSSWPLSDKLL